MKKATKATQMIAATVMAVMCHAVSAHAYALKVKAKVKIKAQPIVVTSILKEGFQAKYRTVGQAKDDLLAGTEKFAQGATKVTEINLDPSTMGMVGHGHGPHADLANKLSLMVVHTYSYEKPGMYRQEDVDAFRKKLLDGSWSCPIHTRSNDRSTDNCSRAIDRETNEMVIFTTSPQKLTFVHLAGKMSLNELEQASGGAGGVIIVHPIPPIPPVPPVPPVHVQPYTPAPTAPTPPSTTLP
jgi:Domain of unknown function (DUF4252)